MERRRDLDLNLLRVLVAVADTGSVTRAAASLYVTQPAVSAALRRLGEAVGERLFVRRGRGLALTARGERLVARARPLLAELVAAALEHERFDPLTSDRTVRIGLSDTSEAWLLPPLLAFLREAAPGMRVVVLPVQFRTAAEVLERADALVTVADELPSSTHRRPLYSGGFVCLSDARVVTLPDPLTVDAWLALEHVIVSYNGDLRGIVEDLFGLARNVRCSVPGFLGLGAILDGTRLVATVPERVADDLCAHRPHLRKSPLPIALDGSYVELIWRAAVDDDPAGRFVREAIVRLSA